jgi:hypothetical protein
MNKSYSTARILTGTGEVKKYDLGTQPNFIAALKAANKVVHSLRETTVFNVRLIEVV